MTLFDLCRPLATVAIVGTAKNVGKTTCLNHLIERHEALGHRMGLTSVGRDGEDLDAVTDRPKPRITPPPGTIVATAQLSAKRSQARLKEIGPTPFRTAIGPVALYEVMGSGSVEVAGPVTVADTVALVGMLKAHGAKHVFVDGAIDRRASASTEVAEGVVLATGLALSEDPAEVLHHTAMQASWLCLPAPSWSEVPTKTGALLHTGEFLPWPGSTLIEQGPALASWLPAEASGLLLTGALTEGIAKGLLGHRDLEVVVPDGTHLLLNERTFDQLLDRGFRFYAARPIHLVAVTVNPTSPFGATTQPAAFLAAMRDRLAPVPVFDVVYESRVAPIG